MRYNRSYHEKVLQINLAVGLGVPFHTSSVDSPPLPCGAMSNSRFNSTLGREKPEIETHGHLLCDHMFYDKGKADT